MKLLVIGHCALDVRHHADGTEREAYGGILHAARTLSALVDRADRVVPVFGVHRTEAAALGEYLRTLPGIDASGIFPADNPMHRVHLFEQASGTSLTCTNAPGAPIPFERIRRHLECDGILINMVSGFDITLETLDEIRMAVRGHGIPLHFDFHNLTLGMRDTHERFRRPIPEWRRWAFMADSVQLNEEEIAGLYVEPLTEAQTAGHLLTLGVRAVVVTRAERGATLYVSEHKHVVREDILPLPGSSPDGCVGCGDVFGAAFLLALARKASMSDAARYAVHIAGGQTQRLQEGHAHVTAG